jgi:hypothetical protein
LKRAVSVSLGSPQRDKKVIIELNGTQIELSRIGTGGDAAKARQLFAQLDGEVDALSVGGVDLYLRFDDREYPLRAALKLVQDVGQTPLVDGRGLKHTLERRVFELAAPALGELPHFQAAFVPMAVDRLGLARAVTAVSDTVIFGDLMMGLGLPIPVRGIDRYRKVARALLPIVSYFPLSMIFPPGIKDEPIKPKYEHIWQQVDLVAGDFLYMYKHLPAELPGKTIVTNTTTDANVALLRERGVRWLITTTPRYDGRSFGTNMMEAALTAYAGYGRVLTDDELNNLIDDLDLRPTVERLNA